MASYSRPKLPSIPDLRFEQSFFRSISSHVYVSNNRRRAEKRAEKYGQDEGAPPEGDLKTIQTSAGPAGVVPLPASPLQTVRVDWAAVLWVTLKEQVLSPLLQGAIWGVASVYAVPMLYAAGGNIRHFWNSHVGATSGHQRGEGSGVGRIRAWGRGLGLNIG